MPSNSALIREPHPVSLYRARHKLSMGQLARTIGISTPALSRIESGAVDMPSMQVIAKLASISRGEVSEFDIYRWHFAAAQGIVPALRAPMTTNFNWSWVRPPAGAQRASASA